MFKHSRKTDVPQDGAKSSDSEGKGSWFKRNQRSIIAVGLIVIMAFIMRFVFAYGVSADSAFALSGGSVASEHLHTITQILNGGSFFGVDDTLSYPFGSVNSNPVLIDSILAGIAMIGTSLGMSAVKAASLTLATFSLVCGTFAVIPMFFLGKEVIGTRKAGFVAAIFLAFCPIVITQTVFSNGTETGWILLLFIILSLLMFKGIKEIMVSSRTEDPFKEVVAVNKSALKLAAFSGLVLALIVLSTNVFRPMVIMMVIAMAIMTVVGRFMYRDTRPVVLFFSIIILIGMAVGAAYYIPAQLWDQVLSGVLITSLVAIALCLTFSLLQRKPWVVTVPVYLIGVVVALVLMYFFAPEYYDLIVNGNTIYAACIAPLTGGSLSVSFMSTAFGVVTMWFTVFVIGVLIWKIPKNISSFRYQFLVIYMFFCVCMTFMSEQMATIFSPVFALGFAYIVMWLFDHVDFKTYFMTIKNAGWKNAWKKVLKPIPFATIIIIAGLLCVPIGMYAIDASISNNEKSDYEGLDLGAIGYYVKTNDDWTVGPVLKSYADVDKAGALVTWTEYANDSATMGKFKVIVDGEGNGAEAVSNILLSNAVDGSSDAVMLIYLVTYKGLTDEVKGALNMSAENYETFEKIINNPSQFREKVVTDTSKYGILESDVSDDNIRYIYGSEFLTEKYSGYEISERYSAVAAIAGDISYFMVDGSMFPLYYGYSSMFSTMAYANDYVISDNYGTAPQFLTVGTYTYYTGIYEYTDAMYNTLMWRAYIGMSPEEAGLSTVYEYFQYLMLSDGTYKVHPGYGLSNYTVDYDHWYVMYNPDKEATVSSDGWEKMLYTEAIEKQGTEGGLINYLSGLPVFMKYVPNSTGSAVSGKVTNSAASANIQGIRVSVVDSEGTVRSTAFTNENGEYKVLVTGTDPKLKFYSGSQNLTDGNLIQTVNYSDVPESGVQNIAIKETTVSGAFVDSDDNATPLVGAQFVLKGKVSKAEYSTTGATPTLVITGASFESDAGVDMVPDVYDVTLKSADGKITYATGKTITVSPGENLGLNITLDLKKTTITIYDDARVPTVFTGPNYVILKDATTGEVISSTLETNAKGEIEINLVPGSYVCSFAGDFVSASSPFTVTSDSSSASVYAHTATAVGFSGFPANKMISIYSTGYQTTALTDGSGNATVKLPNGLGEGAVYTAYAFDGTKGYIATSASPAATEATIKVSGTMKSSSDETVSGTILFINGAIQVPVSVASDGTYSVYLTAADYTVYANSDSEVSISKTNVSAEMTNDITLGERKTISGSASWGSSSTAMAFVPIVISNISGCDGCTFTVTTDYLGQYSFYIPKDSTCDLQARLSTTGAYYYGTSAAKEYTKSATEQSGSVDAFKASVDDLSVTNNFGYAIIVNSVSIANGATKDVPVTGSWTVEIDDETSVFYSKKTLYNRPGVDVDPITSTFFNGETKYYRHTVTGLSDGDKVTVKSTNGGAVGKSYPSSHKYYLEYTDDTEKKVFMFTVTNSDSTRIGYATKTVNDMAVHDVPVAVSESATVKGYVGYNGTGTMTLTYDAGSFDFSISSGRYSISVPAGKALTLSAAIDDESASVTYQYRRTLDVPALTAGSTNVYNMAVTSTTAPGTDEMTATMVVDSAVDGALADVDFTVTFTKPASGDLTTYSLNGGSKWYEVRFYNALLQEITTVTFDDTATVYGKGRVIKSNVAYADEGLSVILTDPNGETVCTATITDGEDEWDAIRTTPTASTTKISITGNSLGDSEYMYAYKIVNDDNFAKLFSFVPTGIDTDKWYVTYVYDKTITQGPVAIKGYTTATVFVKITYKSGDEAPALPENITTEITVTDLNGAAISEISTDTADSVTIAGNVATANSVTNDSTISVDGNSASGRDVVNKKSDMPVYVWLLIALAVAALFLIIWAASKRGVFSRRK